MVSFGERFKIINQQIAMKGDCRVVGKLAKIKLHILREDNLFKLLRTGWNDRIKNPISILSKSK